MADFNKGLSREDKKKVNKAINQTVTGVAETMLSDINQWRKVLAENPDKLPFDLPPTLQKDIDQLNESIAFTGLKIPPVNELDTALKKKLGELAQPTLMDINQKLDPLDVKAKRGLEDIKQITWLG